MCQNRTRQILENWENCNGEQKLQNRRADTKLAYEVFYYHVMVSYLWKNLLECTKYSLYMDSSFIDFAKYVTKPLYLSYVY